MKLFTDKGTLTLPDKFAFEIRSCHPFFSTDGTASTPVTIPADKNNCEILDNPEHINRTTRALRIFDATISSGLFHKKCKLVIDTFGRMSGISISLALQESELYASVQARKIPEVFASVVKLFSTRYYPSPFEIYNGVRTGDDGNYSVDDLCFFPVAADLENGNISTILNQPGTNSFRKSPLSIGGVNISTPDGYGTAPFLYLWALIEEAFELCGYKISENIFRTDNCLCNIVVLHNCADAVSVQSIAWSVNYRHIVPDITVGELIKWLRDKFGAIVSVIGDSVSIRLMRDMLSLAPDGYLTSYARTGYTITYPEPKQLAIGVDTSIESAEPASSSLENLIASHSTMAMINNDSQASGIGLFFWPAMGKYYVKKTSDETPKMMGTNAYAYKRSLGLEEEMITADDTFAPMVKVNGVGYVPFVGKSVRRKIDTTDRDEGYDQKLMICYAVLGSTYSGTTSNYDSSGSPLSSQVPLLTPEGIASAYWKGYENLIVNGCPQIECKLDIALADLMTMDMTTPKEFMNAKVLIRELKYTISKAGISVCDAVLQVIGNYIDSVRIDTPSFGSSLTWQREDTCSIQEYGNKRNGIRILERDGLTDYSPSQAPDNIPFKAGIKAMERSRWLKYRKYYTGFLEFGHSEHYHHYKEYFISTHQGD